MVLGISPDTPKAQLKFKEKYDLPYTLLADDKKEVAKKYDVLKEKNMYGKKVIGIVRSTFLIGPDGKTRARVLAGEARRTCGRSAGVGEGGGEEVRSRGYTFCTRCTSRTPGILRTPLMMRSRCLTSAMSTMMSTVA